MANENITLTEAYRNTLELNESYFKYHSLPVNEAVGQNDTFSYSDCNAARKKCINQAYSYASDRLSPANTCSISMDAASYYSQQLRMKLLPTLDYLKQLCSLVRLDMVYDMVIKAFQESEKDLLSKFKQELQENPDYYSLYKIEYFLEKVEIKENDYRYSEHPLGRLLERLITDNIEYTFEGAFESIQEMEDDLNKIAATFYKQAYITYTDYVSNVITIIEILDREITTYCSGKPEVLKLKQKIIASLA